jgi:two-component system phosphate regulon sensor histidine kinase PhoR
MKLFLKVFLIASVFCIVPLFIYYRLQPLIGITIPVFITLISVTLLFVFLYNLLKPLDHIENIASKFSAGDYSLKIFPPEDRQLKSIASSLNSMAKQLDEKLYIIGEQSNLQKVVLESMNEGVIAIDNDEKILLMNKTAGSILGIQGIDYIGRTLQEVVRISEIQKFFRKLKDTVGELESEIMLHEKDKYLQLRGSKMYDADNNQLGALVVINDVSNLKFLDTLKKDLVANVSHELKTPVTTIKGFIETLKEGAIHEPENAERFLDIIYKHIERLNLLIDDMLVLAKLEEKPDDKVELQDENIMQLLRSVKEDYDLISSRKKITVNINCEDDLKARINRHLIEQALGNLLDNAIKYSDKKSEIEIGAYIKDNMLHLYVEDEGIGIAHEHIPRLFERFYRVDKGRSRDVGGTGLGLAIVKHIVNACGGTIDVESSPGKGSIFTVKLPIVTEIK